MKKKTLTLAVLAVSLLASCGGTQTASVVGESHPEELTSTTVQHTRPYIEPAKETQAPISFYYDENNNLVGVFQTTTGITTTTVTTTVTTTDTTTTTTTETESTTTTPNNVIIAPDNFEPQPKKDMDYFNDCVFVGDSIIKSLSGYLILDESAVIAKIGISPRKILDTPFNTYYGNMTALEALQKTNANKIYILLGSNSLDSSSSSEDEKILKYYGEFLDSIQTTLPNTTLYVISITPVTDHCKYKLNNERITKFNTKLYSLCTQRGVYYVDAYSQWFDEDGQLLKEYYEPDGLHLRHNGCDKLLDILLENTAQ